MPLFKRRDSGDDAHESGEDSARVLSERDILDRIEEEIFRAGRYDRPLVVLCVLRQRLGDELSTPAEMRHAVEAVSAQLRFSDRVGVLADGTIVAVLPETAGDMVRPVAHRVAADLSLRAGATGSRKWLTGTATFPEDGADPPAIVTAAMQRARG